MGHCLIQGVFLFLSHAFLRPIDVGCAALAAERVCYVTCYLEGAFGQPRIFFSAVDGSNFGERLRTFAHIISLTVEKDEPKGLKHADAAVIGGASADSDYKVPASLCDSIVDHLAYAVGGGRQGVLPVRGNKRDSGGRSHLDDGGFRFFQVSVICMNLCSHRPGDRKIDALAFHSFDQGIRGALSTVSQGLYNDFCIRLGGKDSLLDCNTGFHGSQASF